MSDDEVTPSNGMLMNIVSSAFWLADDAQGLMNDRTEENKNDYVSSLRIMRNRIDKALKEIGEQ